MGENLKLDVSAAPFSAFEGAQPQPGDVYRKAGGERGFWLIVAVRGGSAHAMSFDAEGQVTGSQSYRASYFAENETRRVGRADIHMITVEWNP